jgi:sugar phosphate isomerase/epimerase
MTSSLAEVPYSFSMINLVQLLPEWSWAGFDQVMAQAGTNRVELVPSMILGGDWDQQIGEQSGVVRQALERLLEQYTVGSIQSLTYGLPINLAEPLINHPELLTRLQALAVLAEATGCSVLILGSPGQKKLLNPAMSQAEHKQQFIANCNWMASTLGPKLILSLEHNTSAQGAEYCNTLGDIVDVVATLRRNGTANVGLNLDTKCLIHEFGREVKVGGLLAEPSISEMITSVQVSFDFLTRVTPDRNLDLLQLQAFARIRNLPLSLEEFGLLSSQLTSYVEAWKTQK